MANPIFGNCNPSSFTYVEEKGLIPTNALNNPQAANFCDFLNLISNVMAFAFKLSFYIALGFVGYAAFKMLISMGNPGEIKAANSMMKGVVIGLIIIFSAKAILNLIFTAFGIPGSFFPW